VNGGLPRRQAQHVKNEQSPAREPGHPEAAMVAMSWSRACL
jgi:hypothetical protein